MDITEVRIKLMDDPQDRLQAFCSVTFDKSFVIRDLKIIQGSKGSFVAMPSRKLTDRCPKCHNKNHLRAMFCNQCGVRLDDERAVKNVDGRAKLYADIAHPINSACRELIQQKVIENFKEELIRSENPGYHCSYDDYGEEEYAALKIHHDDEETSTNSNNSPEKTHRLDQAEEKSVPQNHSGNQPDSVRETASKQENSGSGDDFGSGLD